MQAHAVENVFAVVSRIYRRREAALQLAPAASPHHE
jgi:hypothetical protein